MCVRLVGSQHFVAKCLSGVLARQNREGSVNFLSLYISLVFCYFINDHLLLIIVILLFETIPSMLCLYGFVFPRYFSPTGARTASRILSPG